MYVISFQHKTNPVTNFQGNIYVDARTYAYLGFELKKLGISSISPEDIPTHISYLPGNTTIKIGYTTKDNLYFLSYISYKTSGINTSTKVRMFKDIEFVTTSIKTDSVFPIPFDRQFDYTDILSIEADDYSHSYWKDYNILQENNLLSHQTEWLHSQEEAISQLTKMYNTQLTRDEKIMQFLKRFTFEGGFSWQPVQFTGGKHLIGYGSDPIGNSLITPVSPKATSFCLSTLDGVRFELNKHFSLVWNLSAPYMH